MVKYFASVVALLVYAAPLYFRDPALRASQADLTQARCALPPARARAPALAGCAARGDCPPAGLRAAADVPAGCRGCAAAEAGARGARRTTSGRCGSCRTRRGARHPRGRAQTQRRLLSAWRLRYQQPKSGLFPSSLIAALMQ